MGAQITAYFAFIATTKMIQSNDAHPCEQGDSPFVKQIKQATLSNFRRMGPCILFYRIDPVSIQIADSPKKTYGFSQPASSKE